jgi:hypothetical protein
MTERFARPAIIYPVNGNAPAAVTGKTSYVELFNPFGSGVLLKDIIARVSEATFVSYGIVGSTITAAQGGTTEDQNRPPIFDNANFSESRGLKMDETGVAALAQAHTRVKVCGPGTVCYVEAQSGVSKYEYEFGQYGNFKLNPATVTELRLDGLVLGEHRHLIFRNDVFGQPIRVEFNWTEVPTTP